MELREINEALEKGIREQERQKVVRWLDALKANPDLLAEVRTLLSGDVILSGDAVKQFARVIRDEIQKAKP
jgi:hypothetical protein